MILPMTAMGTTFTMNSTQLQSLHQTGENPDSNGTVLIEPVGILSNSAKNTGNIRTNETGWGQIQIGANFWGEPYTMLLLGFGLISLAAVGRKNLKKK